MAASQAEKTRQQLANKVKEKNKFIEEQVRRIEASAASSVFSYNELSKRYT